MSKEERSPQEWRDLLKEVTYPEEVRATEGRRARREAKRQYRADSRRQALEYVRSERRREPIKPAAAVIIIALILALGAGSRWLWPSLVGNDERDTVTVSPTTRQDSSPAEGSDRSARPSPSSSPAADRSEPEHVAEEAVRLYLTRNPKQDKEHSASILRAKAYMTPALVENLSSSSDPAWDELVSRGGVATVTNVKTAAAGEDLPVDSPVRVWRTVRVTIHVAGYTTYNDKKELKTEVSKTSDGWRVSRVLGL